MRASLRGLALAPATSYSGPFDAKLVVPSGETTVLDLAVVDASGAPFDLSGGALTVSATLDGAPAFSKPATILAGTGGTATLSLSPSDTLAASGRADWGATFVRASVSTSIALLSPLRIAPALGRP